jgi:hypothetical protein
MAYQTVVDLIRDTANAVNGAGTFVHARRTDGSIEYKGAMPQIHLYPFEIETSIADSYTETYSLLIGFWFQDKPTSTPLQREALMKQADELSQAFILALDANQDIELSAIRKEPNYRQLSGTLTGQIIQFTLTLTTDVC